MQPVLIVLAILFALIYLLELVVLLSWYAPYYRTGIVVFSRRYAVSKQFELHPRALRLRLVSRRDPAFLFHQLARNEVAFRERLIKLRLVNHTPLMRGLLEFDSEGRALMITGRLQWSLIVLALLFLLVPVAVGMIPGLLFPLVLALTVLILLAIDRAHFEQLAARLVHEVNL